MYFYYDEVPWSTPTKPYFSTNRMQTKPDLRFKPLLISCQFLRNRDLELSPKLKFMIFKKKKENLTRPLHKISNWWTWLDSWALLFLTPDSRQKIYCLSIQKSFKIVNYIASLRVYDRDSTSSNFSCFVVLFSAALLNMSNAIT